MKKNLILKWSSGAVVSFGLLFAQMTLAQSTNAPVMRISKSDVDIPSVLTWNSRTNELYTILYSTNLADGWAVASTGFPNQGTNTIWGDFGSESSEGDRFSSANADAPMRFYRVAVEGYTSNSFFANITFSNVQGGSVLSELTNILAGATSASNLISGKLSVDGREVAFDSGGSYEFPLETRFFQNGIHRLTLTIEDNGDSGTTGGDDPSGPSEGGESKASYAAKNIAVTFDNFISDVRLRYQGYRQELGETQQIHGLWASPRDWQVSITPADDTNTIYRAFSGSGTKILVLWDGLDSNSNPLDPQRIAYVIEDLGAAQQPQSSLKAPSTAKSGKSQMVAPALPPLPTDKKYWSDSKINPDAIIAVPSENQSTATRDSATDKSLLVKPAVAFDGSSAKNYSPLDFNGGTLPPFIIYSPYNTLGSFGMMYQGHHPWFSPSNRPQRGAPFGQVTLASNHQPPWGPLKAAKRIADDLMPGFWVFGYKIGFINGDDDFTASMLQKGSLGGQSLFNTVNLGLYVGHSAAGKQGVVALGHPQSYIPVYNSSAGTMTWVGMNDMNLGSSNLKWMAFYSCNLFRSSSYRADDVYDVMKNNNHLAMNSSLHVMQAYATEMTVRSDMGKHWNKALINLTGSATDGTVIGAWDYVCRKTQPKSAQDTDENVARSIFWPECQGDHIYGYGSQTDPDPSNTAGDLVEHDAHANDP